MRLYRILGRTGKHRKGLFPWFKAPEPGAPVRYIGWLWDPALKTWKMIAVEPVRAVFTVPKYPKPTTKPKPDEPPRAEGWYYDKGADDWFPTVLVAEPVRLEMQHPMPPGALVDDSILDEASLLTIDMLIRLLMGAGMTEAQARAAMEQYVSLTAGMTMAEKNALWKHAAKQIIHVWRRSHMVRNLAHYEGMIKYLQEYYHIYGSKLGAAATTATLFAIAAIVSYLIGSLLRDLVSPPLDYRTLKETYRYYLMGPQQWYYSRMIGRTQKGRPYYYQCKEIGTSYVRLKRGTGAGKIDIIDFPGGFVETGYVFPYFVKYTWIYWTLSYAGFLDHIGHNLYAMRKGNFDTGGLRPGQALPESEWCPDFTWYL